MRPLKREGRRSQYCGPSDSPKHTKFCHDRSSILITTPYGYDAVHALCVTFSFNRKFPIQESKSFAAALCQSFLLAMSGHAGPIQMDLGVTPLMLWISLGQAVAFLKGPRACCADLNVGNRASDGGCGEQKSRDGGYWPAAM